MDLVIVESPSKAKTICKYLGKGYSVVASGGHVRDLPTKKLGVDVDNDFKIEYEITQTKQKTIAQLLSEVKKADKVYLATDPDREGEAISWHLKEILKLKDNKNRIVFNEISKKAVTKAITEARNIDMNLVDSQQARRVLDRIVGYKASPVISKKIKSGLSAGRVQSVALKMIVEREIEIRNFKPEEFWNLHAYITKDNKKTVYKSEFNDINGKKTKVTNADDAISIVEGSKAGNWYVDKVKRAETFSKPNPPFTTSTMQQDANNKLNMSSLSTMQIAQKLYEGVEIKGEGQIALVTYIRTDSVRISDDAVAQAKEYIKDNFGQEYLPKQANVYTTKQSAQDAHEAIRPITLEITPDSLKGKIDNNFYRLYKLIYNRFLASQMSNARFDTLNVHIISNNVAEKKKFGWTLKGKTLIFDGYTVIYNNAEKDKDEEDESSVLPDFTEEEKLSLKEIKKEQKFTKPPLRYTDSSLVKAMEENGIGRPSTYASIISVLAKRIYTEKESKYIKPTQLGEIVCEQLIAYFPDIMDAKFTASMEEKLDKIADGGVRWQTLLADFYPEFNKKVIKAYYDGKKVKMEQEVTETVCEKCGAYMVVKEGKFGKFLACPNYPECKNTKPLESDVSKCPKCGGQVLKRMSKKKKVYYACSDYKNCDFYAFDLPAPYFCPECSSTMKIVKKGDEETYCCTNRQCNYKEKPNTGNNGENKGEKIIDIVESAKSIIDNNNDDIDLV